MKGCCWFIAPKTTQCTLDNVPNVNFKLTQKSPASHHLSRQVQSSHQFSVKSRSESSERSTSLLMSKAFAQKQRSGTSLTEGRNAEVGREAAGSEETWMIQKADLYSVDPRAPKMERILSSLCTWLIATKTTDKMSPNRFIRTCATASYGFIRRTEASTPRSMPSLQMPGVGRHYAVTNVQRQVSRLTGCLRSFR